MPMGGFSGDSSFASANKNGISGWLGMDGPELFGVCRKSAVPAVGQKTYFLFGPCYFMS